VESKAKERRGASHQVDNQFKTWIISGQKKSYIRCLMKTIPTLYEWAGGQEVFERLTELFYSKVLRDELLEPVFRHMSPEHSKHVAHFIAEVFGGPKTYTEGDKGSHAGMVRHHLGRMLTEAQRRRWMALLLDSADEIGLAQDPEFRSALVGYIEWGSRLAVMNSNTDNNPVSESEPMPKWGWGETGGPYQP
jgi:hemoglobin